MILSFFIVNRCSGVACIGTNTRLSLVIGNVKSWLRVGVKPNIEGGDPDCQPRPAARPPPFHDRFKGYHF